MKWAYVAAVVLITLGSAGAANARCNPEEARQQYVCNGIIDCAQLRITYQQLLTLTTKEIVVDFVNKYAAQVLKSVIALAAPTIIAIVAAPINDYQCRASITFNDLELHRVVKAVILSKLIASISVNPMANIELMVASSKVNLLETLLETWTSAAMRCVNRNPTYTEGLPFEDKELHCQ